MSNSRRFRLKVLGSFSLTTDGNDIPLPKPTQRLLAFLALENRPALRSYVGGALWPNASESHASGNLRTALWRLSGMTDQVVIPGPGRLALDPHLEVDLHRMTATVQSLLTGRTSSLEFPVAELLMAGEVLTGWYEDWVVVERERFRELRLRALEQLCEELAYFGRFGEAVEIGLTAVWSDGLRESAHRALIKAYLLEGNVVQAVRQYEACRQILKDELGVEPTSRTVELLSERGIPLQGGPLRSRNRILRA